VSHNRVVVGAAAAAVVLAVGVIVTAVRMRTLHCDPAEDALWDHYAEVRPGTSDHPNALWARHWWVGDDKTPCDYRKLARQIRELGLTDVFFHAGPLRPDGTVAPDRYQHAKQLVDAMHELIPGVRIQAYLGQFEGTRPGTDDLNLSDPDNLQRTVDSAKTFLDLGFDGINYDIEPIHNDDQRFIELFDRTRALTKPRGAVLSTAIEERQVDPDSGFAPNPAPVRPTDEWLRTLAGHVDQIAIMTYDSGLNTEADYERWTEYQTRTIATLVADQVTVFIGVPTDKAYTSNHTSAENAGTGARGLRRGVADLPPELAANVGGAIFAEWVSTEDDYRTYEQEWVRPPGS
jgi:hypothetical protein